MKNITYFIEALVQLALFSLVPFIWWLIVGRKKEKFFGWLGLKKVEKNVPVWKILVTASGTMVVYLAAMIIVMKLFLDEGMNATSEFAGKGWNAFFMILVYAMIKTSLSEEILFRGFLLKRFSSKFGFLCGNTIQAILFGLLHGLPFGLVSKNVIVLILLTIFPAAMGWMEGYINEKQSGGSLLPSWIMHAIMNILSAMSAAL